MKEIRLLFCILLLASVAYSAACENYNLQSEITLEAIDETGTPSQYQDVPNGYYKQGDLLTVKEFRIYNNGDMVVPKFRAKFSITKPDGTKFSLGVSNEPIPSILPHSNYNLTVGQREILDQNGYWDVDLHLYNFTCTGANIQSNSLLINNKNAMRFEVRSTGDVETQESNQRSFWLDIAGIVLSLFVGSGIILFVYLKISQSRKDKPKEGFEISYGKH